jgi:hypothetical protein
MAGTTPGDDPGWGKVGDVLIGAVAPWIAAGRAATAPNVLVTLRTTFLSFACSALLIGVTALYFADSADDPLLDTGPGTIAVLVLGGVGVVAARRMRGLECGDAGALVGSYRTRFFIRLGSSEAAALEGFVVSLLTGSVVPYLAGLVIAAIGFAGVAPTRAALQRDQAELAAQGCAHDLAALLAEARFG